jgi:hypothetical protein
VKSSIYWDVIPCSLVEVYRRFGITYNLHLQIIKELQANNQEASKNVLLVSCLTYSSTLKMEAVRSSEAPIDFYRTTLHCIPESIT